MKVTIIGAGVMGSALAIPLADNGHHVSLWGTKYDTKLLESISSTGMHPGLRIKMPQTIKVFQASELEQAIEDSKTIVQAVSSQGVREILRELAPFLREGVCLLTVTKGLEKGSDGRIVTISETIEHEISKKIERIPIIAVGGPQIAAEVANHIPTAVVFASKNSKKARLCQKVFTTPNYKVVTDRDVIGVELCASLKNVYAIGVAFCDGLKEKKNPPFMDNTKAALFTYALDEMMKIVEQKGGKKETVVTLAGVGDLDVTCRKAEGRNVAFGKLLGLGLSPSEALEEMRKRGGIVEGYETAKKAFELIRELEVKKKLRMKEDTPLLRQIYSVLYEEKTSEEALEDFFADRF